MNNKITETRLALHTHTHTHTHTDNILESIGGELLCRQ